MQYQQEKIIYIPNKSEVETIEKLKDLLSKKCDLYIDGQVLVLTSYVAGGGVYTGRGAAGIATPLQTNITATVTPFKSGSIVTILQEKPTISCKYLLLILLIGLLIVWFIGFMFHVVSLPRMPDREYLLPLAVAFGGIFLWLKVLIRRWLHKRLS